MTEKNPKSLELLQSSLRCSCALRRSGHKAWEDQPCPSGETQAKPPLWRYN